MIGGGGLGGDWGGVTGGVDWGGDWGGDWGLRARARALSLCPEHRSKMFVCFFLALATF